MTAETLTPLAKVKEIADILRCSPKTVHRWCHTDALPHVQTRGGKRFDIDKVRRWIAQRETTIRPATSPAQADDQVVDKKGGARPAPAPAPARKFGRVGRK